MVTEHQERLPVLAENIRVTEEQSTLQELQAAERNALDEYNFWLSCTSNLQPPLSPIYEFEYFE